MEEKIVTETNLKEVSVIGKLIFEADLGRSAVAGSIEADEIIVRAGTSIYSGSSIWSHGYISSQSNVCSNGDISSQGDIFSKGDLSSRGDLSSHGNLVSERRISCHGYIRSSGDIQSQGSIYARNGISSGGGIHSDSSIHSKGCIHSKGDIFSRGSIFSKGHVSSHSDIYFSYHFKAARVSCRLLRIAVTEDFERSFWLEKYKLFGFTKMVKIIKTGCVEELLPKHQNLSKAYKKKLLNHKGWTKIERMVIKSWLDGGLKDYLMV